jgi:hypothetical protein
MRAKDIVVGRVYIAKVNGQLRKVRVDRIGFSSTTDRKTYDVTNLATGRKVTFRSAAKFRGEVKVGPVPKDDYKNTTHYEMLSDEDRKTYDMEVQQQRDKEEIDYGPFNSERTPTTVIARTMVVKPADEVLNGDPRILAEMRQLYDKNGPQDTGLKCPPPPLTPKQQENVRKSMSDFASRFQQLSQPKTSGVPHVDTGTIAGYTPTEEQRQIILTADEVQKLKEQGRVMVVAAGAGTGKTSTLKMLEEVLEGLGQYTAFNTALVAESRSKFKRAACNTTHSLAFKQVGRIYAARLNSNRIKSEQVARMLGITHFSVKVAEGDLLYTDPETEEEKRTPPVIKVLEPGFLAGQVMQAVRRFCQSADKEVKPEHFRYIDGIDLDRDEWGRPTKDNNNKVRDYLLPFAHKAWEDLSDPNGQLPFNHDVYVKVWQLGEGKDKPYIPAAYILLDEAQDTAPVLLDILKQQAHAFVILVGDDNQQIYDWRGAVNAMGAFPDAPRRLLSQSFRFGQAIADVANSVLKRLSKPTDLVMKGLSSIPSRVAEVGEPDCILCRTNAVAISTFLGALEKGKRPYLVGGGADTVSFCKAALDLQNGKPTKHPELSCFNSWKEVEEYVKTDEGEELKLMVKLIDEFGAEVIIEALEKMPSEEDADLTISTVHKSKGREWSTVKLAQDFPTAGKMSDSDVRLLYVAVTRAQHVLDVSSCPPFSKTAALDDDGDDDYGKVIEVKYSRPMPTTEELADFLKARKEKSEVPLTKEVTTSSPPSMPDKPANGAFTWARRNDTYVVRGPKGYEGQTVMVTRKDGTTKSVRLGIAVEKTIGDWFYKV